MHSTMTIVLAGAPRLVRVLEESPASRRDRGRQRAVTIDFEVPGCDHMALGRELHLAFDDVPLRDEHGTAWQAVTMSSTIGSEWDTRLFRVELVEL